MKHVTANKGCIAHLAGDAILAEFADADSALHCAINVQLAALQWNRSSDAEHQVLFRIGVNFGDVICDHGDIYGNAVNLAARLENLASSGGVCVSDSVMDKLEGNSAFKFVAMGNQYVKNISVPVRVFSIEIDSRRVVEPGYTNAVKVSAATS
jgi:class 3 adenylate cyclase